MHSSAADTVDRDRARRIASLSPDERLMLMAELTAQGLTTHMERFGVDRATAVASIKATRRLGRRPSVSAHADAD